MAGDIFSGLRPEQKLGRLVSTFIYSRRDEPTYWSSHDSRGEWSPEDMARAVVAASSDYSLIRKVDETPKIPPPPKPGGLEEWARKNNFYYGEMRGVALSVDSAEDRSKLTKQLELFLVHPELSSKSRALLSLWVDSLDNQKIEKDHLLETIRKSSHSAEFEEARAEAVLAMKKADKTLPARPGVFPHFSNFLVQMRETAPAAVTLDLDTSPFEELGAKIKIRITDPNTKDALFLLLRTWAGFLPADIVSKQDLANWQQIRISILPENQKNPSQRRLAMVQGKAYILANDPLGLLELYSTVPRRDETGHENLVSLSLQKSIQELFDSQPKPGPDHVAALESIMNDGTMPDHAAASKWIDSSLKKPTARIVQSILELGMAESLLHEYDNTPDERKRILEAIRDAKYLDNRKRDLLRAVELRAPFRRNWETVKDCQGYLGHLMPADAEPAVGNPSSP